MDWILAVVLVSGDPAKVSVHPSERACVETGENWYREMTEIRKRLKLPPPKGWLCTPVEDMPS